MSIRSFFLLSLFDDLIPINNKRFNEFISDISTPKNSSFLRLQNLLQLLLISTYFFTRDENNNITTKLYDKRDAFGFHIVNFFFMSSNIPSAPAYGVYASQLICLNYSDFLSHHGGPRDKTFVTWLQN